MTRVSAVLITRETEYPRDIQLNFPFDEVFIETACTNVRRRYERALEARNETIYVQDDDAQVDIQALWQHYDGRLTHAITPGHQFIYRNTGVTLVGWGCFFPKKLINFARWEKQYGEVDPMEADRIFTYLAQPHNSVIMPIRQFQRPVKMCERPGHYATKDRIIKMLHALEVEV